MYVKVTWRQPIIRIPMGKGLQISDLRKWGDHVFLIVKTSIRLVISIYVAKYYFQIDRNSYVGGDKLETW